MWLLCLHTNGGWLLDEFAYVGNDTTVFVPSTVPFYQQTSRRCADGAERKVKGAQSKHRHVFNQSELQTGWTLTRHQQSLQPQVQATPLSDLYPGPVGSPVAGS